MMLEVILFGAIMVLAICRAPSIFRKLNMDVNETFASIEQETEEVKTIQYSESIFSFLAD